jgi:hypothetical protein
VYGGQINANQINAGTIAVSITLLAATIQVNSGSFTINLDNTNLLKVHDSSLPGYSQLTSGACIAEYDSGAGFAEIQITGGSSLGYGQLVLFGSHFGNLLKITPQTVTVAHAGGATLPSAPVGFIVGTINGTTINIPYYS